MLHRISIKPGYAVTREQIATTFDDFVELYEDKAFPDLDLENLSVMPFQYAFA